MTNFAVDLIPEALSDANQQTVAVIFRSLSYQTSTGKTHNTRTAVP